MSSSSEAECLSIIQLLYSWEAFELREIWVFQHFLNPFLLYMVTQNFWLSALIVYVWESVEVFELTQCAGTNCISGAGIPVACSSLPGFVTDNLLGDISQGMWGILTAMLLRIVLDIPDWSPSARSLHPFNANWLFLKRALFFAALFVPSLLATALMAHWYAALVHAATLAGVFLIFAFWNQTSRERAAFWSLKQGDGQFQRSLYWRVYGVWAAYALAMLLLCSYVPLGNSYQTFYMFLGLSWLSMILACCFLDKLPELVDFLTFGCFSIYMGQYRFLEDKKRFQNLEKLRW